MTDGQTQSMQTQPREPKPPYKASSEAGATRRGGRHPFFVLSGLSMLVGCFVLSLAIHQQAEPGRLGLLLGLLGVFNVYEVLVIGLGVFLVKRRGEFRHGACLFGLELLLLIDVTMLYNELLTGSGVVGLVVACLVIVCSLAKLAVIRSALTLTLRRRTWALIVLDLTAILATPAILRSLLLAETLGPIPMHLLWWAAGALLAAHAVVPLTTDKGLDADGGGAPGGPERLRNGWRKGLLTLPFVGVLVHLLAGHVVYDQTLYPADFVPLVLGLGLYLLHQPGLIRRERDRPRVAEITGGWAILLTLWVPEALVLDSYWPPGSPLPLTLWAVGLIWAYTWFRHGTWWLPILAVGSITAGFMGPTPGDVVQTLGHWISTGWSKVSSAASGLIPQTLLGWGITAVVAAFLLLGIGALTSLSRPRPSSRGES